MTTDLKITQGSDKVWDLSLSSTGDFENGDFLDSSLAYAIFGERRASESEVAIASKRRGWIGNEGKNFENGSKLWLFDQSRITRSTLNDIQKSALDALSYLVDDGIASRVQTDVSINNQSVILKVTIFVSPSEVETRYFTLWNNTGR